MKKILRCFIYVAVLLILLLPQFTSANFSDIAKGDIFLPAIQDMSNRGVMLGFQDGSFRPKSDITRAEILKVVFTAFDLPVSAVHVGFRDVPAGHWSAQYIGSAVARGLVNGYPDSTYKPNLPVTRAEALKIIFKAANITPPDYKLSFYDDVPADAWFAKYVEYVRRHHLLTKKSFNFEINDYMPREEVAQIVYILNKIKHPASNKQNNKTELSTTNKKNNSLRYNNFQSITRINPVANIKNIVTDYTSERVNKTPISLAQYDYLPTDAFAGFKLATKVPLQFVKGESTTIVGESSHDDQRVVFFMAKTPKSYKQTFITKANDGLFKIPVDFSEVGGFYVGMIAGNKGKSRIYNINVLDRAGKDLELPPERLQNVVLTYQDFDTYVVWDGPAHQIYRFVFEQGDKKAVAYASMLEKPRWKINYKLLKDFVRGPIKLSVSAAKTKDGFVAGRISQWSPETVIEFRAEQHKFSQIKKNKIKTSAFNNFLSNNSDIVIDLNTISAISAQAQIILPNGTVQQVSLSGSTIDNRRSQDALPNMIVPKGVPAILHYKPVNSGVYVIELNEQTGDPVFNVPFYIDTGYPVLPDYVDLDPGLLKNAQKNLLAFDVANYRREMLGYINHTRQQYGLSQIALSDELNTLAQEHSNDLRDNNYFSHADLTGQSPDDRRKKYGVETFVGENLAKHSSVLSAHQSLMRSAAHRRNILNKTWERVGIGISMEKNGMLVIDEEFSQFSLTPEKINKIRDDLGREINKIRLASNVRPLSKHTDLSEIAVNWSADMSTQNFMNFTNIHNSTTINDQVRKAKVSRANVMLFRHSNYPMIFDELHEQDKVSDPSWEFYGIGLAQNKNGELLTTVILAR